jgi:hypothetical protein
MMQDYSEALNESAQDVSDALGAWLARLVLLYGVPFSYLVPDEDMLPKESLRFFFVDPIWVQHLVEGACSVGSNGYGDALIDRAMNKWVQPNQPADPARDAIVNKTAAGVRDRLRREREGAPLPQETEDLAWPLTGFLLRSAVVEGWRGLEVMAYREASGNEKVAPHPGWTEEQKTKYERENVVPLKALRIEQLSPDVMLGLFNGIIGELVVRQPQEALHFGLTRSGVAFSKTLREMGYKDLSRAGELLTGHAVDLSQSGLMREARGVIDVARVAETMRGALAGLDALPREPATEQVRLTSAEFAVQMIEAAGEFTFIPKRAPRS